MLIGEVATSGSCLSREETAFTNRCQLKKSLFNIQCNHTVDFHCLVIPLMCFVSHSVLAEPRCPSLLFASSCGMARHRGVINRYFKSKEAVMKDVTKSSLKKMKERHAELQPQNETMTMPAPLSSACQPIIDQLQNGRSHLVQGRSVVEEILNSLDDNQLQRVKNVFEGRSAYNEDKLYEVAAIVVKEFEQVDEWREYLLVLKSQILEVFIECFLREFHSEHGNNVNYNIDAFKCLLEEISSYRRRLRGSGSNEPNEREGANCALM